MTPKRKVEVCPSKQRAVLGFLKAFFVRVEQRLSVVPSISDYFPVSVKVGSGPGLNILFFLCSKQRKMTFLLICNLKNSRMPGPSRGLKKLKQGQRGKLFGLDQNILVQV